jgi:hypothetical protein
VLYKPDGSHLSPAGAEARARFVAPAIGLMR